MEELDVNLAVTLAHYEIERAKNGWDVRNHVSFKEVGTDAKVDERWGANLEPIRDSAAFRVNVEAELPFGVFSGKINLALWGLNPLGRDNEMVDKFLHGHEHPLFVMESGLRVAHVDFPFWEVSENLLIILMDWRISSIRTRKRS